MQVAQSCNITEHRMLEELYEDTQKKLEEAYRVIADQKKAIMEKEAEENKGEKDSVKKELAEMKGTNGYAYF